MCLSLTLILICHVRHCQLPIRPRPRYHHAFQVPYCSTDADKFSFFPAQLSGEATPASIAMAPSLDQFKGGLASRHNSKHSGHSYPLPPNHQRPPIPPLPTYHSTLHSLPSHYPYTLHWLLTTPCLCVIVIFDESEYHI